MPINTNVQSVTYTFKNQWNLNDHFCSKLMRESMMLVTIAASSFFV